MPMAVLSNFLIYCVINAFTPGPGNILALNTVTNYGYKKGKPLFFELVIATIGTIATCTWTGLGILRTWKTYQKNYSYAANVSWHIIMEFIRDLYQTAFSDKFKADFL